MSRAEGGRRGPGWRPPAESLPRSQKSEERGIVDTARHAIIDNAHRGAVTAVALTLSLFHLYTGLLGTYPAQVQRPVHLLLSLLLVFLLIPGSRSGRKWLGTASDLILMIATVVAVGYIPSHIGGIAERAGESTPVEPWFAAVAVVVVLEGTRRAIGLPIVVVVLVFLGYAFFGENLPWVIAHRGYESERILSHLYLGLEGIFGVPLGVSATIVALFVIFAGFLRVSGAGQVLMDAATGVSGWSRGGAAKPAVIGSAIMGSISGTAVGNVAATGAVTIPLMKRTGYSGHEAGGIESAASTGSQFTPPIMGAAAFILATFTDTSYLTVVLAAVLPAGLYYVSVFTQVHLKAVRSGMSGLRRAELPSVAQTLAVGGHLILPLLLIFYFLAQGRSPSFAVTYPLLLLVVISWLRKQTRMGPSKIVEGLTAGARLILPVATSTAAAGIVVGVVALTGVGVRFSSLITELGGGNRLAILVLTMLATIVLGMGLPTAPAYIIAASLTAPALVETGVPLLAAHLFVFYSAILSAITPPIAMAAFAASSLAGAPPMRIAGSAMRYGVVAFLVPYIFVYDPVLLGRGSGADISIAAATAVLGVVAIAVGVQGALFTAVSRWTRLIFGCCGVLLVAPFEYGDLTGGVVFATLVALQGVALARRRGQRNLPLSADTTGRDPEGRTT